MEKEVNWSFSALEMVAEIHKYKSDYNPVTADKYIDELFNYVERLQAHPEICAPCKNPILNSLKMRCCLFKKQHIIIYEILENKIEILAVIHARRNPNDLDDVIK